jgi:leucyl aminopeptidase (aminopeptidase T)
MNPCYKVVHHVQDLAEFLRQVVEVCLNVRNGENVWIHSWDHTIDLASEIAFACRQHGAHPFITIATEDYWMRSLAETPKKLLETLPSHQAAALQQTNAFIFMLGPRRPIEWDRIPNEKRELANAWYLDSNKYLESWRKIAQKHSVRMLGIEYCLVTKERAQALGLEYTQWREAMLTGCTVNQQEIAEKAAQLANIMQEGREVSVQTPFGTSLKLELVGRKPIVGDSIVSKEDAAQGIVKFLPSGFVEVAVDEDSAEGTVVYDMPIPVRGAKKIEGLALEFKHGKVVKYSAQAEIGAFENYLRSGQGDVDKLGFFGIGLNPALKHGFTQDDKVLGGVTIGIGGNEDKMGKNRTMENRHWWASMTQATVQIGKELILKNGMEVFSERRKVEA